MKHYHKAIGLAAALATMVTAQATTSSAISAANQAEPIELLRGIPHQALFDVAFDGSHGIAVGAGGEIVVSQDAGQSWAPQKSPSQLSLLGVATRGARTIAVGQMGMILVKNGNADWQAIKTDTTERLMAVDLNAQGLAVVVGTFGTVLKSTDGGQSWHNAAPDWSTMFTAESATLGDAFHPHLYGVKVGDDGKVTIAGELSLIMTSKAGAPWQLAHRGAVNDGRVDPSIFGLDIRDDGVGFAVGQSGMILKTVNGGASWLPQPGGGTAILLGVESGADHRVLITGMREMLASDNDGASWRQVVGGDIATAWYSAAVRPAGSDRILVAGQSGKIISVK
ncbi:WD40/YVTN/BNR-like repeat-containing protein [Hydrocarboniphaga sp.]|uniref:WD40/YVTN/BNR-like repeat-containing protein n=1 Tax=Hydrocarboniphaga sp. TaxID=2033016 RepID=UPI003D100465